MMNDDGLTQRVSEHLRRRGERGVTAAEMNFARKREWFSDYDRSDPEEENDLAQMIADRLPDWRDFLVISSLGRPPVERGGQAGEPAGTIAPEEPKWWRLAEWEILQRHDSTRREMMTLFGLLDEHDVPRGLDAEDQKHFIDEIARTERAEGDWLLLDVPLGWTDTLVAKDGSHYYGLGSERRPAWRGFHLPPPIGSDGSVREMTPAERASEQKLYRLAQAAQKIADETGCLREEAVDYLLGGETPFLPYVDVALDQRYGGYVIIVRDRRIPVNDVAAFYRHRRDSYGSLPRQPREGPYLVVQFVEEAWKVNPREPWSVMYERFSEEHPGRYGSMKSFRQTFYSKKPNRQGK